MRPQRHLPMLLLATLAVVVPAGFETAHATGLELSWEPCDGPQVPHKTFACNTDLGTETLVVSFVPTVGLNKVATSQVFMSLCTEEVPLPAWWQVLGASGCRLGAMTLDLGTAGVSCNSLWDPTATFASHFELESPQALHGFRFVPIVTLIDSTKARDLVAGQTYELLRIQIHNTHTTGVGACAGCAIGARFDAQFVWFFGVDGSGIGTSSFSSATWQVATTICSAATDTKKSTWGALKSLYR